MTFFLYVKISVGRSTPTVPLCSPPSFYEFLFSRQMPTIVSTTGTLDLRRTRNIIILILLYFINLSLIRGV